MQILEYEGAAPKHFLDICFTVKGELSVANFELTLLSGVHFLTLVAVHPYSKVPPLVVIVDRSQFVGS